MAAQLDKTGLNHVPATFFPKHTRQEFEMLRIIRIHEGVIEFTPEFLQDANLASNYRVLASLASDWRAIICHVEPVNLLAG